MRAYRIGTSSFEFINNAAISALAADAISEFIIFVSIEIDLFIHLPSLFPK